VKNNTWKKKKDLENTKEAVAEFKKRKNVEVRRQEKLNMVEERSFRQGKLLGKYTARMLYKWDDGKFEKEYLRKLERNWMKWKGKMLQKANSSSGSRNLEGGDNVRVANLRLNIFPIFSYFYIFSSFFFFSFTFYLYFYFL